MKNLSEIYKMVLPVLAGLFLVVGGYFVYTKFFTESNNSLHNQNVVYVFDMKGFIDSERAKVLEGVFSGDAEKRKKIFQRRMKYLREFLSNVDGVVFVKGAIVSAGEILK
ncbi:hypothetical protein [Persephonella sp. KM09-Lau-8]|uniref:hypothetical protein n=1 Tax=Persephonella sp. KM09-Lau-8 TaxID=1158345 RepID=UPI0004969806|nr:hypothetical protein [Persephonella sp. KM09-Lau-8]